MAAQHSPATVESAPDERRTIGHNGGAGRLPAHLDVVPARELELHVSGTKLRATLVRPKAATGMLVFASADPERTHVLTTVAQEAQRDGFATLTVDLLDEISRDLDVDQLAARAIGVIDWLEEGATARRLPIGLFGSGIAASALLIAAVHRPHAIHAVVSCSGRLDLVRSLPCVHAPTLLVVGRGDPVGLELNRAALGKLPKGSLTIVTGASAHFDEPGVVHRVARLASTWFAPFAQRSVLSA